MQRVEKFGTMNFAQAAQILLCTNSFDSKAVSVVILGLALFGLFGKDEKK
jgi:hypothetical protein